MFRTNEIPCVRGNKQFSTMICNNCGELSHSLPCAESNKVTAFINNNIIVWLKVTVCTCSRGPMLFSMTCVHHDTFNGFVFIEFSYRVLKRLCICGVQK